MLAKSTKEPIWPSNKVPCNLVAYLSAQISRQAVIGGLSGRIAHRYVWRLQKRLKGSLSSVLDLSRFDCWLAGAVSRGYGSSFSGPPSNFGGSDGAGGGGGMGAFAAAPAPAPIYAPPPQDPLSPPAMAPSPQSKFKNMLKKVGSGLEPASKCTNSANCQVFRLIYSTSSR